MRRNKKYRKKATEFPGDTLKWRTRYLLLWSVDHEATWVDHPSVVFENEQTVLISFNILIGSDLIPDVGCDSWITSACVTIRKQHEWVETFKCFMDEAQRFSSNTSRLQSLCWERLPWLTGVSANHRWMSAPLRLGPLWVISAVRQRVRFKAVHWFWLVPRGNTCITSSDTGGWCH